MEMVLDVYKRPYDKRFPVVCMDESPKQLIEESRPSLPLTPGREKRVDYEYIRHGVVNVFMASEPLAGTRFTQVTEHKTKREWAQFVKKISANYPDAEKITLVMDNYNTHVAGAFYEIFKPEEAKSLWDRFEFVFTPKHGSWLNMAEIELHVLTRQCLSRHIATMDEVIEEVEAWRNYRNGIKPKINWRFTTKDARIKLKRLYPSIYT